MSSARHRQAERPAIDSCEASDFGCRRTEACTTRIRNCRGRVAGGDQASRARRNTECGSLSSPCVWRQRGRSASPRGRRNPSGSTDRISLRRVRRAYSRKDLGGQRSPPAPRCARSSGSAACGLTRPSLTLLLTSCAGCGGRHWIFKRICRKTLTVWGTSPCTVLLDEPRSVR